MKVAVDVMGGDYGPAETIAGAVLWAEKNDDSHIFLVGNEEIIKKELHQYTYRQSQFSIINGPEVIGMDESPALALRKKRNASIVVATELVKKKIAEAVLSCGSTGAQMTAALFLLGRLEGIERPPIVAAIPNIQGKHSLLIDVGANVDCKARQLLQFAVLGKAYAVISFGKDDPTIGLLNNGEEETKGNQVTINAYQLLKNSNNLNFVGNIEGREIFSGKSDVIICDGFTGNIVLKTLEGMVLFLTSQLKKENNSIPALFSDLDYTQVGGAPLLGVDGVSIVCHGSSRREAVYNGLRVARQCVTKNIVELQKSELAKMVLE